eukprot:1155728-Pelagomonas_calceolata.AAC.14
MQMEFVYPPTISIRGVGSEHIQRCNPLSATDTQHYAALVSFPVAPVALFCNPLKRGRGNIVLATGQIRLTGVNFARLRACA